MEPEECLFLKQTEKQFSSITPTHTCKREKKSNISTPLIHTKK